MSQTPPAVLEASVSLGNTSSPSVPSSPKKEQDWATVFQQQQRQLQQEEEREQQNAASSLSTAASPSPRHPQLAPVAAPTASAATPPRAAVVDKKETDNEKAAASVNLLSPLSLQTGGAPASPLRFASASAASPRRAIFGMGSSPRSFSPNGSATFSAADVAAANSAMKAAAQQKLLEVEQARMEREKSTSLNSSSPLAGLTLHFATNRDMADYMLLQGAELNLLDRCGCTPLHNAAQAGRADVVSLLLQRGANAKIVSIDELKATALDLAAENQHPECVALLTRAGAQRTAASIERERAAVKSPRHGSTASGLYLDPITAASPPRSALSGGGKKQPAPQAAGAPNSERAKSAPAHVASAAQRRQQQQQQQRHCSPGEMIVGGAPGVTLHEGSLHASPRPSVPRAGVKRTKSNSPPPTTGSMASPSPNNGVVQISPIFLHQQRVVQVDLTSFKPDIRHPPPPSASTFVAASSGALHGARIVAAHVSPKQAFQDAEEARLNVEGPRAWPDSIQVKDKKSMSAWVRSATPRMPVFVDVGRGVQLPMHNVPCLAGGMSDGAAGAARILRTNSASNSAAVGAGGSGVTGAAKKPVVTFPRSKLSVVKPSPTRRHDSPTTTATSAAEDSKSRCVASPSSAASAVEPKTARQLAHLKLTANAASAAALASEKRENRIQQQRVEIDLPAPRPFPRPSPNRAATPTQRRVPKDEVLARVISDRPVDPAEIEKQKQLTSRLAAPKYTTYLIASDERHERERVLIPHRGGFVHVCQGSTAVASPTPSSSSAAAAGGVASARAAAAAEEQPPLVPAEWLKRQREQLEAATQKIARENSEELKRAMGADGARVERRQQQEPAAASGTFSQQQQQQQPPQAATSNESATRRKSASPPRRTDTPTRQRTLQVVHQLRGEREVVMVPYNGSFVAQSRPVTREEPIVAQRRREQQFYAEAEREEQHHLQLQEQKRKQLQARQLQEAELARLEQREVSDNKKSKREPERFQTSTDGATLEQKQNSVASVASEPKEQRQLHQEKHRGNQEGAENETAFEPEPRQPQEQDQQQQQQQQPTKRLSPSADLKRRISPVRQNPAGTPHRVATLTGSPLRMNLTPPPQILQQQQQPLQLLRRNSPILKKALRESPQKPEQHQQRQHDSPTKQRATTPLCHKKHQTVTYAFGPGMTQQRLLARHHGSEDSAQQQQLSVSTTGAVVQDHRNLNASFGIVGARGNGVSTKIALPTTTAEQVASHSPSPLLSPFAQQQQQREQRFKVVTRATRTMTTATTTANKYEIGGTDQQQQQQQVATVVPEGQVEDVSIISHNKYHQHHHHHQHQQQRSIIMQVSPTSSQRAVVGTTPRNQTPPRNTPTLVQPRWHNS